MKLFIIFAILILFVRNVGCAPPTRSPTKSPTRSPTKTPTRVPSFAAKRPTPKPSKSPTLKPTRFPTSHPTSRPSSRPSGRPSGRPSSRPSKKPTPVPTKKIVPSGSGSSSSSSKKPNSAQIIGILFGVGAGLVIVYGAYSYINAKKGDPVDQEESGVEITNPVHDGNNKDYDDTF